MEKMGELLLKARKQKGMTQEQLASLLNVSRQTISKWENNETKPDIESIYKLCEILEITIEQLNIPYKPKRKCKLEQKWMYSIVCLVIGICLGLGIGFMVFAPSNVSKNKIPDDFIIHQEIKKVNEYGKVQYKAFTNENLSNYEVTCIYRDTTLDSEKEFAGLIGDNSITCTEWVSKSHTSEIYIRVKRNDNEKVFFAYEFKLNEYNVLEMLEWK